LRSTGETSKSKPARSRCTGNLAVCILVADRSHQRDQWIPACSRRQQPAELSSALPPCHPDRSALAMPCMRGCLSSTANSRAVDLTRLQPDHAAELS
jgi:hypothetical protein